MPSTRALIHAPWSASKVATALRCPRIFHLKYIQKIPEPEVMPEARIGKAIHKALELALHGRGVAVATAEARIALIDDDEAERYDQLSTGIAPFVERVGQFRRRRRVARQLVEYSLAIREDASVTQFYSGDAYFRGVIDLGYLFDDDTLALVDHKTGRRYTGPGSHHITEQLEGYAVLTTAAFRYAEAVWLGIHWVGERTLEWAQPLTAPHIQERLVPNLFDNIEAAALAVDDGPRTNPGTHCERCAYRANCPARTAKNMPWLDYDYEEDDD